MEKDDQNPGEGGAGEAAEPEATESPKHIILTDRLLFSSALLERNARTTNAITTDAAPEDEE